MSQTTVTQTTVSPPTVTHVYNQVGHLYNRDRRGLRSTRYLHELLQLLPKHATVLDVGCGNGQPVDVMLVQKNYLVTGLDSSPSQIRAARHNCPRGEFIVRDMQTLRPGEFAVEAVVCLYTLFHIDRHKHAQILRVFRSFLPVDGHLLITMGDRDFVGETDFYGQPLWSSQYGPSINRQLVTDAGFTILRDEIDRSGGEAHQVILARAI